MHNFKINQKKQPTLPSTGQDNDKEFIAINTIVAAF